jgi:ABC-2 type transport system permease protein
MTTLISFSRFEVRRTLRNRQFVFFSLVMPILFYFIFLKVNGANLQMEGTTWKTYFLMSMAAFSVVGSSLFGLAGRISYERTQGWLRLVQTTPMSSSSYVVSKFVSQVIICALSVIILFVVGGLSQGVSLTVGQWAVSLIWLSLGVLPFMSLGLLIGVLGNVNASSSIANIVNLVLAMLGGLWFPVTIMPKWMQSLAHYTPTYRFAHVAWNVVAGKSATFTDVTVLAGYLVLFVLLTIAVLNRQEATTL